MAAVLGTPTAQTELVPALMRCYAAADFVVGLDVDKDDFDKFGMRHSIGARACMHACVYVCVCVCMHARACMHACVCECVCALP